MKISRTQRTPRRAGLLRGMALLVLASVSGAGLAASAYPGYYEPIPYYGNNPFLFCTLGVPQDCWAPVNPATGAFVVTNQYCFNAYSAAMYARVCPHAFPHGLTGGLGQNAGATAGVGAAVGGAGAMGGTGAGTGSGAGYSSGGTAGQGGRGTPVNPKPKVNCGHVYCAPVEVQ